MKCPKLAPSCYYLACSSIVSQDELSDVRRRMKADARQNDRLSQVVSSGRETVA